MTQAKPNLTDQAQIAGPKAGDEPAHRRQGRGLAEARELAERYRIINELSSDYIYLDWVEEDGTVVPLWVTDGFTRMTGYDVEEARQPGFFERFIHPEHAAAMVAHLGRLLGGEADDFTGRVLRKDGSTCWVTHTGRPIFDPVAGRVNRLYGSVRDITASVEAEERLRKNEEVILAGQRIANIGSWEVDLVGNTLTWSPQCYHIFGQDQQTFQPTNESFFAAIHPADHDKVKTASERAQATGELYEVEHRILLPDGSIRHVRERAEIECDAAGRPARMIGTCLDITEHMRSEEALRQAYSALTDAHRQVVAQMSERDLAEALLRESEGRYRGLVESMEEGLMLADFAERLIYANPAAERIFGLPSGGLIGRSLRDFVDEADFARLQAQTELRQRGEHSVYDMDIRRPDGQVRRLRNSVSPVRNAAGETTASMAIFTDISEQAQLQSRLQEEQREESIIMLAGGIAHDFNNMLMGVLGAAALLNDQLPPADTASRELVEAVHTSATRMADLTDKLLAYARGGKYRPRTMDLNEAVRNTALMVRGTKPSGLEIELELAEDLWSIEADMGQLEQVLLNLLVNAIEAIAAVEGGRGLIRITTANEWTAQLHPRPIRVPAAAQCVRVSVTDTGCGMTPETLERVFDPFFSTKFQGRGLGMAASSGIILNHGGVIWAESAPGQGAVFQVLLPAVGRTVTPASPSVPLRAATGGTVLVIDDDPGARSMSRRMLQAQGYNVMTADDGRSGIDSYRRHSKSIQLVLLDMQMPDLSGVEVLQAIRELDAGVPVVLCSGYSAQDSLEGLEDLQVSAFLAKPYEPQGLARAIHTALKSSVPATDVPVGS